MRAPIFHKPDEFVASAVKPLRNAPSLGQASNVQCTLSRGAVRYTEM
jgi:hypothetical protein